MSTAALVTAAKRRKQRKCPSTDERISGATSYNRMLLGRNKEWNTDVCYNLDETWKVKKRERSQTEELTDCVTLSEEVSRRGKSRETENRWVVAGAGSGKKWEVATWWIQGCLSGWWKCSGTKERGQTVAQQCECIKQHEAVCFTLVKMVNFTLCYEFYHN